MAQLRVVPIGALPPGASQGLALRLRQHGFAATVESAPSAQVTALVGPGSGKLDAHFALAALRRGGDGRVLGLTGVDLKGDARPVLYGLAEVNGKVAVFSTSPFFERGLLPEEALDRLAAAVLHELAHTLGMVHCRRRGCLMNATHEPAVLRRLEPRFCAPCEQLWRSRVARTR